MCHKLSSMILATATVALAASFVQGQTHALWPTDWNNWSDPALMVTVVNAGNAGEWSGQSYGSNGPDRICGAVSYAYNIGKYEVTAGQYAAFLNAVAKTDTYGLYNTSMWSDTSYGCKIQRSGTAGNYTYSVASDCANRPVNYVSWGDSTRFANWLNNGQPTGEQSLSTTEDGAYYLNGATTNPDLTAVSREADWKWAVTSEDEWYKAAYYKGGSTSAGYWDYPTSSDTAPGCNMADASGNNANYYAGTSYPIDSGKYTTLVGEFQDSASPYGTLDQGGNVWEWNESVLYSLSRGVRGGSFDINSGTLLASHRGSYIPPAHEYSTLGFRVASVFKFLPGDANKSGTVDIADLSLLLDNINKTGMVWANGDFNGDGMVNVFDLTLLLGNYNKSFGAGAVAGIAVPEPGSLAMLAGIASTALLYWWRKRTQAFILLLNTKQASPRVISYAAQVRCHPPRMFIFRGGD
jgi:formylglycine-generating enzyme